MGVRDSPTGRRCRSGDTPVLAHDGDHVSVESEEHAELLLMCGERIGEPIAAGGGFVMNTREEIEQAFDDYQRGRMGALAASQET